MTTPSLTDEELAELQALTDLATNLGDGMKGLGPANIARPFTIFCEVYGTPEFLSEAQSFADRFLDWQTARAKGHTKLLWDQYAAHADVLLFVRRKIWQRKVSQGQVVHPVARMLATTVTLHRAYRADVHEALNHAAKHNTEVAALGQELRDQLDTVVRERLEETTRMIAGAALATMPQLQNMLLQERLTHDK